PDGRNVDLRQLVPPVQQRPVHVGDQQSVVRHGQPLRYLDRTLVRARPCRSLRCGETGAVGQPCPRDKRVSRAAVECIWIVWVSENGTLDASCPYSARGTGGKVAGCRCVSAYVGRRSRETGFCDKSTRRSKQLTKLARRTYLAAAWLMLAGLILAPAVGAQGTVTVLCSPSVVWCDVIKEEFPKATGINLEYIRLSSGEGLARLRAERNNPTFDVWFGGTGDPHFVAFAEGLTEFYRPSSWDDLIPAFREVTGESYLPLYAGILGWTVNDQLLESMGLPIPRTWKDLTNPVYRRLVATPNPNTSGTGYTMLATILQIYGEDEGWQLLRDLHLNIAQYTRAGAEPGLLAGRGEVAIGVTFMHDALNQAIQGFPVSVRAPADGTGFEIGGLSLVRNGPNREAAIRFI